jgi:hypothetical protein
VWVILWVAIASARRSSYGAFLPLTATGVIGPSFSTATAIWRRAKTSGSRTSRITGRHGAGVPDWRRSVAAHNCVVAARLFDSFFQASPSAGKCNHLRAI